MLISFLSKAIAQVQKNETKLLLVEKIHTILRTVADKLQSGMGRLSKKGQKTAIFLFVIVSATACLSVIFSGFISSGNIRLSINSVQKPRYSTLSITDISSAINKQTPHSIEKKFKRYIDSLDAVVKGIEDSRLRQSLIDSLKQLQTIFFKQQKQMSWKRQHTH